MELKGYSSAELGPALNAMESNLAIGQAAVISLVGTNHLTQEGLTKFRADIEAGGFHLAGKLSQTKQGEVYEVKIPLKKGSPQWALLVPMIPLVILAGLIVFGIMSLGAITKAILPLIIAIGGFSIVAIGLIQAPKIAEAVRR